MSGTPFSSVKVRHRTKPALGVSVAPSTLPVQFPQLGDSALSIGFMLQEGAGFSLNQYWVNVVQSQPWSTLTTPEWDVIVVRLG